MSYRSAPGNLRHRILNCFPAAHYAMDGLLGLLDIGLDDSVESAAVECRTTPRLLLNPGFIERHCRSDEHLLMLVMHEVHHVLLGHTRLFPRITEAQNIAFDAVINSLLCHMFPSEAYRGFFEKMNAADTFPSCLLRPPPGWPLHPEPPATLPESVREVVLALYGKAGVGYSELFRILEQTACEDVFELGWILLGDHGPEEGREGRSLEAARASVLLDAIRAVVEKWPTPPDPGHGRSVGGELRETLVAWRRGIPSAIALLRRMFHTLAIEGAGTTQRTKQGLVDRVASTPIPQLRDRRAVVRGLLGAPPLLFQTELPQPKATPTPALVHVYVDVSGSTGPYQADLFAAVRPHMRSGSCVVHCFSGGVVDLDRRGVSLGRVYTTGGTDMACVTAHMLEHRISRALLLTDGYVGPVPKMHREWLARSRARLDVALTPGGDRKQLEGIARKFVELPIKKGNNED